jgi:hypothetical protein
MYVELVDVFSAFVDMENLRMVLILKMERD